MILTQRVFFFWKLDFLLMTLQPMAVKNSLLLLSSILLITKLMANYNAQSTTIPRLKIPKLKIHKVPKYPKIELITN